MRQNNLSHHSSPFSSIYSASSTHIVESDKEILWFKVDFVLISMIQMYQDHTRWPTFQYNHLDTVLLSQTSNLSRSQYYCLLQNDSHGIIRMHWHLNHVWDKTIFHIIPLFLLIYIHIFLLILLKVIERYYDWKWIVFLFPLFKCTKITLDDVPFRIIISNTVLLSQSSCLNQLQYWCLLQNQSNGVIRMHWHLNHVCDKTIFQIIPHLLLLNIQLLQLILLKVIERYYDWKWIVLSFPWIKCTKMTLDDLPFRIIISIQSYWVRLHIWFIPNIDACCKMIVMVSSECIGI